MNKATVKDLQKRIDELERVVDELTATLKKELGGPSPAWFYRRERPARLVDSQNRPPGQGSE